LFFFFLIICDVNIKKTFSLKLFVTATRPTSHDLNSKNQKGAITLAARCHNVHDFFRQRMTNAF